MAEEESRVGWARWMRDPLALFLAIGALVFLLDAWLGDRIAGENRIVIEQARVDRQRELWFAQTGRQPNEQELDGLVQDMVREEILYREAQRLGLDRDDVIVRRRLAQKVTFLMDDTTTVPDPSAKELAEFFEAEADRYREPERTTFRHVYFSREREGFAERAQAAREELQREDSAWRRSGDPFMLNREYAERSTTDLIELFGRDFAAAIGDLSVGSWDGPIESAYGTHVVYVERRTPARSRGLEEVKGQVLEDYRTQKRRSMNEEAYRRIADRYEVEIEND